MFKTEDGAKGKVRGWILFWLLGYPIAVLTFVALSHARLF
jgi:hypothetical protein